jgi:hypothetical protein
MIDHRFSKEAFAKCGLDTQAARDLADSLAQEVREEAHHIIQEYMHKVAARLNEMGHNLRSESDSPGDNLYPGDISYRDDWQDEGGYHCRLRIAIATVISTGYAHLLTAEDAISTKSLYE